MVTYSEWFEPPRQECYGNHRQKGN